MTRLTFKNLLSLLSGVLLATGCSRGPTALVPPDVDPSSASSAAMKQYDANGDGSLSGEELAKSPSLKTSLKRVDTNQDGAISRDEIEARINAWQASKVGLFPARCAITLNGVPLEGAEVRFEPESFLEGEVLEAMGVTDGFGNTVPAIPKDKRPQPSMPDGIQSGFYTVRITRPVNGKESLPAKFNSESQLGEEISMETPGIQTGYIRFDLKTR